MKKILGFFLTLAFVIILAGCTQESAEVLLKEAKDDLTIVFKGDDTASSVTQKITLITAGINEVSITWSSSDTDVIANDGTVNRPAYGEGDATVTLTATLRLEEEEVTKEFELTVKELPQSNQAKLDDAKTTLAITYSGSDNKDSVTDDVTLPTTVGEVSVSWESTLPSVISTGGQVTRPAKGQADATVALTATLTIGNLTDTKGFTLKVKAISYEHADEEAVANTKKSIIILSGLTSTDRDFDLPGAGSNGTVITWESLDTDHITIETTDDGYLAKVTRPAVDAGDAVVTLTATITKGDYSATREFEITVVEELPLAGGTVAEVLAQAKDTPIKLDEATVFAVIDDGYYVYDSTGYIFVYTSSTPEGVAVGDNISLKGNYTIYYNQPEIEDAHDVVVISSDNTLPTPVEKTLAEIVAFDTADKTIYAKMYKITGTVTKKTVGSNTNVFIVDESGNEVDINYKSNADVFDQFVGEKVIIDVVLHTFRTDTQAWRMSFVGTADDVEVDQASNQEQLDTALANLKLPADVYGDLDLVDESGDVEITWVISDTNLVTADGVVTRGETDAPVTLTATLTIGELSQDKVFNLTVKALNVVTLNDVLTTSNVDDVVDVEGIVVGVLQQGYFLYDGTASIYVFTYSKPTVEKGDQVQITGEYTVYEGQPELQYVKRTVELTEGTYTAPTTTPKTIAEINAVADTDSTFYSKYLSVHGLVTIQGSYNNVFIIDNDGNQIEIYYKSDAATVKAFDGKFVNLNVVVYRYSDDHWQVAYVDGDNGITEVAAADNAEKITQAVYLLDLDTTVIEDLTLPGTSGEATVTWATDNADVIAADGTINRGAVDATATLTASITIGDTTVTKEFDITVLADVLTINDVITNSEVDDIVSVQGIVTGVLKQGYYLYDGTATIYVFTYDEPTVEVGDEIEVEAEYTIYEGQPELQYIEATYELTISTYSMPQPTAKTIAELNAIASTDKTIYGQYLAIHGFVILQGSYNNVFIIDNDGNEIEIYYKSDAATVEDFEGNFVDINVVVYRYDEDHWQVAYVDGETGVSEVAAATDAEKLTAAKYEFELDYTTVIEDMTLPGTFGEATVTWTSDNTDVIAADGTVTRGATDEIVTLTAILTINDSSVTKEFEVTVLADVLTINEVVTNSEVDDIVSVQGIVVGVLQQGYYLYDGTSTIYVFTYDEPTVEVGDEIEIEAEYTIYEGQPELQYVEATYELTISTYSMPQPTAKTIAELNAIASTDKTIYSQYLKIRGFVIVQGNFSNGYVIDNDGNEIEIYYKSDAASVKDFEGKFVELNVVVYRYSDDHWQVAYVDGTTGISEVAAADDAEKLLAAVYNLTLDEEVIENITLPDTSGEVSITWASDNTDVIGNDGVVTRPSIGEADVTVKLTATLTINSSQETKEFNIKVKALEEPSNYDYTETFDDSSATGSYGDGSFTGVNGVEWTFVKSRDEATYGIDGSGIMLRDIDYSSSLTGTFTGGIASFEFEYRKAYTGGSDRQLEIVVTDADGNSQTFTTEIFGNFSGADETVYTFESGDLNLSGTVTVTINDLGAQTIVDNFAWSEVQ